MTHTLHPEILDEIVNSMNHYVDKHMYHALGMKKVLEKHLGPYLNMPQPIENEPNGNSSVTHVKPENVSHAFDDISLPNSVSKDNEPLPENPSMYVGDEGGQRGAEVHKYNTVEEQKQSIPKIEKIEPINEDTMGDRIPNKQTYFNKVDELVDGYNTLIDYINNTLPTSKDA